MVLAYDFLALGDICVAHLPALSLGKTITICLTFILNVRQPCYWRSRYCFTGVCPSVCLSVCLSVCPGKNWKTT